MKRPLSLVRSLVAVAALGIGVGCSQEGSYDLSWDFGPAPATPPPSADGGASDGGVDAGGVDAGADGGLPDGGGDASAASDGADTDGADGAAEAADGAVTADGAVSATQSTLLLADAGAPADRGCGAHGVYGIRVTGVSDNGDGEDFVAPCTPGHVRRTVAPGTWTFTLRGLDARGRFKEPVTSMILTTLVRDVVVKADATTTVPTVTLAPQPACRDGVDNDGDGLVDLADPDCANDPQGGWEGVPVSELDASAAR
jgi:hypothetical protein